MSQQYQSQILVAQPKNRSPIFHHSCVIIARHDHQGATGFIINKQMDRDFYLSDIVRSQGIDSTIKLEDSIYMGGPLEQSKVFVIHSTDWRGPTTTMITADLAYTIDISILLALSRSQGPSRYRAVCGISSWFAGQLEGEQSGQHPWRAEHRWLTCAATADLVFDRTDHDQWFHCLERAVSKEVSAWI